MRTTIDLSDALIAEAGRFARGRTRKAIVEEALEVYIAMKTREARRRSYGDRVRMLEQRTAALSLGSSPTELLCADRDRP